MLLFLTSCSPGNNSSTTKPHKPSSQPNHGTIYFRLFSIIRAKMSSSKNSLKSGRASQIITNPIWTMNRWRIAVLWVRVASRRSIGHTASPADRAKDTLTTRRAFSLRRAFQSRSTLWPLFKTYMTANSIKNSKIASLKRPKNLLTACKRKST